MKSENPDNIELICKGCSNERKALWQKQNKGLCVNVGDFVKIAIKNNKGEIEHFWLEVLDKGKRNTFTGRIDNTPILDMPVKYNDIVAFQFKDIEAYLSKDEKC